MDEEEAIRRSQEGEHNAFRFLVERHSRVLHGTTYLMTQDRALAEDMAQEALLLAWRGLPSFKGGTNFRAWLLRILVNRSDLTVPEVTRALGCREATVKSRLHRAMTRLRELLHGEEAQSTVLGQEG